MAWAARVARRAQAAARAPVGGGGGGSGGSGGGGGGGGSGSFDAGSSETAVIGDGGTRAELPPPTDGGAPEAPAAPCDPVKQVGCLQAGEACHAFPQNGWQCLLSGAGVEDAACVGPSDCRAGYGCFPGPQGTSCKPYCDPVAPACTSKNPVCQVLPGSRWGTCVTAATADAGPPPPVSCDPLGQTGCSPARGRLLRVRRQQRTGLPAGRDADLVLHLQRPHRLRPRRRLLRRPQRPAVPAVLPHRRRRMSGPGTGLHDDRPQRLWRVRRRDHVRRRRDRDGAAQARVDDGSTRVLQVTPMQDRRKRALRFGPVTALQVQGSPEL